MMKGDIELNDLDERRAFEAWFRSAMHIGGKCFVDAATKRRMFRAWMARAKQESNYGN